MFHASDRRWSLIGLVMIIKLASPNRNLVQKVNDDKTTD